MDVLPHQSAPTQSAFELAVVHVHSDGVSIRAAGELDRVATDDLARLLASELAAGHVFVRMDLSGVTSLDCSCLGTLKEAHDGCLASHGLLLLEGLRDGTRQVFEAAGLDRCLFLTRTTGPSEWPLNLPRLADLVRAQWMAITRLRST